MPLQHRKLHEVRGGRGGEGSGSSNLRTTPPRSEALQLLQVVVVALVLLVLATVGIAAFIASAPVEPTEGVIDTSTLGASSSEVLGVETSFDNSNRGEESVRQEMAKQASKESPAPSIWLSAEEEKWPAQQHKSQPVVQPGGHRRPQAPGMPAAQSPGRVFVVRTPGDRGAGEWERDHAEDLRPHLPADLPDRLASLPDVFPPDSLWEDLQAGVIAVTLPRPPQVPTDWPNSPFAQAQAAAQASASRAVVLPSAPRVMQSRWTPNSGMYSFAGAHIRGPTVMTAMAEDMGVPELSKACEDSPTCEGVVPGVGLVSGVSASVAGTTKSAKSALARTKDMFDILTRQPVTADSLLAPASQQSASPLAAFAGVHNMNFPLDAPRLQRVEVSKENWEEEAAAACLEMPRCVGFWDGSLMGASPEVAAIVGGILAGVEGAGNTTMGVATTLVTAATLDSRPGALVFIKLPTEQGAAAVLRGATGSLPDAVGEAISAWLSDSGGLQPPPVLHPCGSPSLLNSPGLQAACTSSEVLSKAVEDANTPLPVRQAVRDLVAVRLVRQLRVGYLTSTLLSMAAELQACTVKGVQVFVGDTTHLHEQQDTPSAHPAMHGLAVLFDPDYAQLFGAVAWIPLPCVSMLQGWRYLRLQEVAPPPHEWGNPYQTPQQVAAAAKKHKRAKRGLVQQDLDFASLALAVATAAPSASLLMWEDDCLMCPGTLGELANTEATLATADAAYGALKVGNGGSGMQMAPALSWPLVAYLITRRGALNVDVLMWRLLQEGRLTDYISHYTWSAHRGRRSSLKPAHGMVATWGRVMCGNELDHYWGEYVECHHPDLAGVWKCGDFTPEAQAALARQEAEAKTEAEAAKEA